jgi:hypothetical protein
MYSEEIHDPHLTPNGRWVNKHGGAGVRGRGTWHRSVRRNRDAGYRKETNWKAKV